MRRFFLKCSKPQQRKLKLFIVFVLIFITCMLILSNKQLNEHSARQKDIILVEEDNESSDKTVAKNKNCNIFKEEEAYSVNINGHVYPQFQLLSQNQSYNFDCVNQLGRNKLILGWNKFYGDTNMGYGGGKTEPFAKRHCPVTNCEMTSDKSRLDEADYVVVHYSDEPGTIPKERNAKTRWVWMLIEAPYYTKSFENLNGLFNYTSDFQYESEFGSNYISQMRMIWKENKTFNEAHNYQAGKTGQVTALISNCGAMGGKRMAYMNKLKEFIGVDVYGHCGQHKCPHDKSVDCREYVGSKYKFYFSFENCLCKDYITEKFFLMLKFDIVPVVFGGGNYTRYIPKSAFVDAQDFQSAKHLAEYLNYLDKNVTAYNEYFKWKRHVSFLEQTVEWGMICDMCIQLHLEEVMGIKKKVVTDFAKYWSRGEHCKNPGTVPQFSDLKLIVV